MQNKDTKKMGTKPTRDTRAKKEAYKSGTLTKSNKKSKKDYDKINFKDEAYDAWNKVTAITPKNKLQKSNTPFSKVRNFMGFGDAPKLNK